jgi:hypothetical protein
MHALSHVAIRGVFCDVFREAIGYWLRYCPAGRGQFSVVRRNPGLQPAADSLIRLDRETEHRRRMTIIRSETCNRARCAGLIGNRRTVDESVPG